MKNQEQNTEIVEKKIMILDQKVKRLQIVIMGKKNIF